MLSQMAQIQPRKINSIRIMAVITKFVNICVSCGDFFSYRQNLLDTGHKLNLN